MGGDSVRLFQRACHAWLALYMIAMLASGGMVWSNAPVRIFSPGHGISSFITRWDAGSLAPAVLMGICVTIIALCTVQMRRHRWWLGLAAWVLFRIVTHRTWLASNGGVQLMENMLIWCALMGEGVHALVSTTAFWSARLQLLVAYAAAAAHKFTGTAWLDGSAVMMVANDPGFSLGWLASTPGLCEVLTYATLSFMTLFPFAIWWVPTRRLFLTVGVLFHLATALFMGIPQMGLAFIACYAVWMEDDVVARWSEVLRRLFRSPDRARWDQGAGHPRSSASLRG